MTASPLKRAHRTLQARLLGMRLLTLAVTARAPYFRTIRPTIVSLAPGRGEVRMRDRWGVHNHLGTVHAIACCNLVELVGGTTMDVSLPDTHRWIPKGMQVAYLAKARGTLTAVATVEDLHAAGALGAAQAREVVVPVEVTDPAGRTVVHADITMWVSPR